MFPDDRTRVLSRALSSHARRAVSLPFADATVMILKLRRRFRRR